MTLDDVFQTDQAKSHDEFWLYVLGYAHLFNVDTNGPDTCDDWSFQYLTANSSGSQNPKVTQVLRRRINDVTQMVLNTYQDVINAYSPPDNMHLKFVDVSPGFNGHRLCEAGKTYNQQWYDDDLAIWNLSFFNGLAEELVLQLLTLDFDFNTRFSTQQMRDDMDATSSGSNCNNSPVTLGWTCRPMHPKENGHGFIKDAVIAAMRADNVPGVKG